jgi:ParB family chromosome partitioning protein
MAKATKKQALGRGLSALLNEDTIVQTKARHTVGNIIELDLNSIEVNPFQPRSSFN